MHKISLIDIGESALKLQDILIESQGELTPEMEAALDEVLSKGSEALDGGAAVVRRLSSEADICKTEAKRLTDRAKSFDNQAESLKGRMLFAVDAAFGGKLKTERNTIWGQNAGTVTSIEVAPDADIEQMAREVPGCFRRTYSLDKVEIKHRYEAEDPEWPVPHGVTIQVLPGKRSLRLK